MLDDIVRRASDEPLLLLCSFRPQFQPIWALTDGGAELRLSALTNVIATEIIRERLEGQALSEDLVELGVAKSEGNPLFAEEFASYLSQKGAHREQTGDAGFGEGLLGGLDDIPTSLENLIMDRVHRLGRDTISFLQAASVLGRQFPMNLAKQVADINGKMVGLLPQLELHGLIFRVDREFGDTPADYAFKHALVQDALYGSLLTPQRAILHQKAAEALEELYGDKAPEIADMLAHHYVRTAPVGEGRLLSVFGGEEEPARVLARRGASLSRPGAGQDRGRPRLRQRQPARRDRGRPAARVLLGGRLHRHARHRREIPGAARGGGRQPGIVAHPGLAR